MNLMFDREVIGDTTRLILEIESREALDKFALKMIGHNHIEYLAPMELMQYDSRNYLQYDISNKDTLDSRLSGVLKKTEVIQMLNSIINAFEETDAYMLSEDGMLLTTDRVYVDGQNHCVFLYLPFEQEHSISRISFLQEVVEHITPDYDDKDTYLFNILNAFNRGAISKIADLKEMLRKNSEKLPSTGEKPQTPERAQVSDGLQPVEKPQTSGKLQIPKKSQLSEKLHIPGKPQASGELYIPGKPHASENPQEPEALQISGKPEDEKSRPSANIPFAIPGKNGDLSINIPGAKKDGDDKKEGKKDKKKENRKSNKRELVQQGIKEEKRIVAKKWPDIPLLGKKEKEINEISQIPQPIANQKDPVQNRNDDMYESYEQTVMMAGQQADNLDSEAKVNSDVSENTAQLERKSTGECIEILQNNAVVGSGSGADCRITGNKAISRTHATISVQNGAFFITDNHSSNGTWVNGSRLIPDKAVEIRSGALIKLANEEFIFRVR